MIRIKETFKKEDYENIEGISEFEIWYNKKDLREMNKRYHFLLKHRYLLPTIAYFLFCITVPAGIALMYLGFNLKQGGRIIWGFIVFLIGLLYVVKQYKVVKNMENHLFKEGIGSGMSRWDRKIRKSLMKKIGKRYWFAFLPFSAIEYIEKRDLTSETSTLLIHTKDGKIWPHPKYGVPYNRTIKGDLKFVEKIFNQYEKWKETHTSPK